MKFNYLGSEFSLDSPRSANKVGKKHAIIDSEYYQRHPNAQIIYLLHEKFYLQDKTRSSHRKHIQKCLEECFQKVNWFTYRSDLELPLLDSNYTSDAGWGCMIRTGQMLLFQALQRHIFEDSFKFEYLKYNRKDKEAYIKLLRLFQDNTSGSVSPFSIHNIISEGKKIDRKPGDWYGPQAISIVLKRLVKIYNPVRNFTMHVCLDGSIYLDKIQQKSQNWNNSVFVVIPLRLGLNNILPEYLQSIKQIFTISQNVGIAGGRENAALYFIGITDLTDNLIYLDPHYVQKAIPSDDVLNDKYLESYIPQYHCQKIKKLQLQKICTSLAIGFYIRNKEEFEMFKGSVKKMSQSENSIFTVYDQKPKEVEIKFQDTKIRSSQQDDDDMDDDFCIL